LRNITDQVLQFNDCRLQQMIFAESYPVTCSNPDLDRIAVQQLHTLIKVMHNDVLICSTILNHYS
jgi:hypothetical protein